jgi:16S rRNA processing protein RimM
MTDPDRLLLMGRLGRSHGIRGDVKVVPETDDPNRFAGLTRVFVGATPQGAAERAVRGVRFQYPKGRVVVLLGLDGMATPEDAEPLRGLNVYADQADLPALGEGEVFLHDLAGLAVWSVDDEGEAVEQLGVVRDIYEGAQLLFAVEREGKPEVLLPDVEEFVAAVDLPGRRLLVRPPEGLFDDTADEVTGRGVEEGGTETE